MHQSPGSKTELFTDKIREPFEIICNKTVFLSENLNIDLGNNNNMFINSVFESLSTNNQTNKNYNSANIFTKVRNGEVSGIFINDVSDHLPVFVICRNCLCRDAAATEDRKMINIKKALEKLKKDFKCYSKNSDL